MKAYEIGRDPQLNLSFHSQLLSKNMLVFIKKRIIGIFKIMQVKMELIKIQEESITQN